MLQTYVTQHEIGFNPRAREDVTPSSRYRAQRGQRFNPRAREDATALSISADGCWEKVRTFAEPFEGATELGCRAHAMRGGV